MRPRLHHIAARPIAMAGWRAVPRLARELLAPLLILAALTAIIPGRPGSGEPAGGGASLTATYLPYWPGAAAAATRTQHGLAGHRAMVLYRAAAAAGQITLVPGDTLGALAVRYHSTVPALQALNMLGTSTLIYAGAAFRVPAGSPRPAAAPRANPQPAAATHGGAARAIAFAMAQLGKPYIWGGTGPAGYDCSGLVMRAWQAAGVQLPRVTYDQVNSGTRISRAQLSPGDLVFSNNDGHVHLYIGGGQVIQAPHTGASVGIAPLPAAGVVDAYVHISPQAIGPS